MGIGFGGIGLGNRDTRLRFIQCLLNGWLSFWDSWKSEQLRGRLCLACGCPRASLASLLWYQALSASGRRSSISPRNSPAWNKALLLRPYPPAFIDLLGTWRQSQWEQKSLMSTRAQRARSAGWLDPLGTHWVAGGVQGQESDCEEGGMELP